MILQSRRVDSWRCAFSLHKLHVDQGPNHVFPPIMAKQEQHRVRARLTDCHNATSSSRQVVLLETASAGAAGADDTSGRRKGKGRGWGAEHYLVSWPSHPHFAATLNPGTGTARETDTASMGKGLLLYELIDLVFHGERGVIGRVGDDVEMWLPGQRGAE